MTAEKALPLGNGKAAEEARESEVLSGGGGGGGAVSARDKRDKAVHERGHWNNKVEFVLSVAGEIIGLGNVWRFPYLCYKNGGGAFLIPYVVFFICCGIPVFFLETALGQFTSEGGITCWRKVCPLFEGNCCIAHHHHPFLTLALLSWQVVYVTATFPYVMLLILLIRGVTLPGASEGVKFYLYPDLSRLSDPQFVCVESLVTAVVDMYPKVFRRGYRRELLILALSVTSYFLGLVMLTEGGMYIFQLFDSYAASGMCLLFVAIFECICIGWVYGSNRFYDNIEDMIGYRPLSLIKWCWKVVTPGICAGIFIFFLVKYKPLKYNNVYTYPPWGYGIGWLMALSSMLCIPVWVCIKVWKTEGTLPERFRKLMIPSADLKMRGTLGAGPRTVVVNDCDAKLKGDGTVAAITEKETHF
ncbi:hypothetical protein FD755_009632 [Muntiacus reevesi]|uniref:Transporter n=1 Tax=Muntiacus reevesi TaxID=9886 RepID=A0A5N3XW26_MUNRE|nr:hypothetical protein FD755_009632 [Muntiacus reevesi]